MDYFDLLSLRSHSMLFYTIVKASWSKALVVLDDKGIISYASLGDNQQKLINCMKSDYARYNKKRKISVPPQYIKEPKLKEMVNSLEIYRKAMEDPKSISPSEISPILDTQPGTEFQRKVWHNLLCETAPLKTTTYGKIAHQLKLPSQHARAIGNACGANRIALLIPCHRVLGSTGNLTGYKWGCHVKQRLLDLEFNS